MYRLIRIHVVVVCAGWWFVLADAFSARRPTTTTTTTTTTTPSSRLPIIRRIPKDDFDPFQDYYKFLCDPDHGDGGSGQKHGCGRPVVIEGALSAAECQACCDRLVAAADTLQVDLQEQIHIQGHHETHIYHCTLEQAIEAIMRDSNSETAYLTFCEGLLEKQQQQQQQAGDDGGLQEVQQWTTLAREGLFENDQDWFDFFPSWAHPTDAVILAGAGATSTLHRDPMEWTGTSLCLEGTKVWRFLEPSTALPSSEEQEQQQNLLPRVFVVDQALQSYRLASIAWEEGDDAEDTVEASCSAALSAGWQSDFSLYHTRDHASIPSAQALAELEDDERDALLYKLAGNFDVLAPNVPFNSRSITIHTVIQKPGDLLLIPAHWWHQTYAFEPSVAIASQRCGKRDAELVFQHILEQQQQQQGRVGTTNSLLKAKSILEDTTPKSPEAAVAHLFDHLLAKI